MLGQLDGTHPLTRKRVGLIAQERVHREGQGRAVKYLRGKVVSGQVNIVARATVTDLAPICPGTRAD